LAIKRGSKLDCRSLGTSSSIRGVGNYRLLAVAVAAVAGLAVRKMMVHLGVQRPLGPRAIIVRSRTTKPLL
jgi:hypothetical protein